MKAVILAGGPNIKLLEPITGTYLTPLLPVLNKPLLEHSISFLKSWGIDEIIVCLNEESKQIMDYFGDGERWGVNIHYLEERHPKGTAGCLLDAKELLDDKFIVIDSTVIPGFNFPEFVKIHEAKNSIATIGVHKLNNGFLPPLERIHLDTNQRISGVTIIHPSKDKRSYLCSTGIYIFEPRILDFIPPQGYFDIKEQLLPCLVQAKLHPHAWIVEGYCNRIRTLYDYWRINQDLLRSNSNSIQREKIREGVWTEGSCDISDNANLIGPIIMGRNCTIADYCQIIGPTVIGDNCHISRGAVVRESVILQDSDIPKNSVVERNIYTGNGNISLSEGLIENDGFKLNHYWHFSRHHSENRSLSLSRNYIQYLLKRIFDIIGSIFGLIILLPFFPIIGLAIKLDSPGPVLFRQTRSGKDGEEFQMIKFRTMVANADSLKEELKEKNDADGPMFKIKNDPRVTRVGKIIRRLCIDEFPQLLNVLKGDMSFVGPRPLAMEEMKFNPAWRDIRLKVKPGITGLWQLNGDDKRNSFYRWIEEDIAYVKNWSIFLDFKILVKTALWFFKSVLRCFSVTLGRRFIGRGTDTFCIRQNHHRVDVDKILDKGEIEKGLQKGG